MYRRAPGGVDLVRSAAKGAVVGGLGLAALVLGLAAALAARPNAAGLPSARTGTGPITAPKPPVAVVVSHSTAGSTLSLTIACKNGYPGAVCSGSVTVTASGGSGSETVGNGSYSLTAGNHSTVDVPLNSAGLSLLDKSYALPATLAVTGTKTADQTIHFRFGRVRSPIAYTFTFSTRATAVDMLTVTQIPSGGSVQVVCHGGGCPFGTSTFSPSGGSVDLRSAFKGVSLQPHDTLELDITAPNRVGKVTIFTVVAGAAPRLVAKCLLPGATNPSRCA
jgi:hypothetical protein